MRTLFFSIFISNRRTLYLLLRLIPLAPQISNLIRVKISPVQLVADIIPLSKVWLRVADFSAYIGRDFDQSFKYPKIGVCLYIFDQTLIPVIPGIYIPVIPCMYHIGIPMFTWAEFRLCSFVQS